MSYKQICDICGQDESSTKFTELPIKLQIKNYKGEAYNVYLSVSIQKSIDESKLDYFYSQMSKYNLTEKSMNKIIDKIGLSTEDTKESKINMGDEEISLPIMENPYPSLCSKCKKSLSTLVLKYGKHNKLEIF